MQLREVPFVQKFDIIVEKKRRVLDIEKNKYKKEQKYVTLYLNGTTGDISSSLEDVIRKGIKYEIIPLKKAKSETIVGYSAEYSKKEEMVVIHLIVRKPIDFMSKGGHIYWKEFTRFAIKKGLYVMAKKSGWHVGKNQRNAYLYTDSYIEKFTDDGNYELCGYGKNALPISANIFDDNITTYVNNEDGSNKGFIKIISNIMPAIFNLSGNNYIPITNYRNMCEYFLKVEQGSTCIKKEGKVQKIIDELVSHKLPEIEPPDDKENLITDEDGIHKFAIIQKVPNLQNICVVRTINYVVEEDYLFEGGRIYVSSSINFCKKNNDGEYVAQALLQKVNHWDFSLNKFPENATKGTLLEYFGKVVPEISEENRAIAIWMFLKEPFLESLAKISSSSFIDSFIDILRNTNDLDNTFMYSFGINKRNSTKILQVLGLSKQQFDIIKDYIEYGMPRFYEYQNVDLVSLGIIPCIKKMILSSQGKDYLESRDISSIDINTFKEYYEFMMDLFELYDVYSFKGRDLNSAYYLINSIITKILEITKRQHEIFPTFDTKQSFEIFKELAYKEMNNIRLYYRNRLEFFTLYDDYLNMVRRLDDKDNYKPKFNNYEDLIVMHDNVSILSTTATNRWQIEKFKTLNETVWKKFEFNQKEEKNKKGEIVKEELPFIVIAPTTPYDLAREGTILHHCVKSYIDRVADQKTNIMFIRNRKEPEVPFFTAEIDNDKVIQQVHGFGNRNADTEKGLEEFIEIYRDKLKLNRNNINKCR